MIKNTQGISKIIMKPFGECKCAIGQDWYHINFEITFIPNGYYPDYMDVSKFVTNSINGKELNIEDAVNVIGEYLYTKYNPAKLTVTADVKDVVTHCPVTVTKEY